VGFSLISLEPNRTLGGVGALLIAIGCLFPFLSLVGIILVLIAMRGLADYYKDDSLFQNALYGFIFGLVGAAAAIVLFIALFLTTFTVTTTVSGPGPSVTASALSFLGFIILILIVAFVFLFIEAIFYRRAFDSLSVKSGEKTFETAGLMLLIGSILVLAFGIGFVLLLVGWILAAVGFFSMKEPTTRAAGPPPPPPSVPMATGKRYCQYCGAENAIDALFCKYCGRKLES
jgi:uncharacterized membrane protein